MTKLRIGFVGFGNQAANHHAKYLVEHCSDTVKIVAICDILPADLPFVQNRLDLFGLQQTFIAPSEHESCLDSTANLEQFLDETPTLDAVIISTPHAKHFSQARVCLHKNLHVLVDKPPALTYAQGKQLVDLTTGPDSPYLLVSSQRRYEKVYQYARQVIISGELGEVTSANSIISHSFDFLQNWRNDPARAGGGVLWDHGWHSIDTIVHVLGRKVLAVDASLYTLANARVETHASVLMHFEGKLALTLTANFGAPKNAVYERLQIWGTRGMLLLERFKPVYDNLPPSIIHQTMDGRIVQPDLTNATAKSWAPTEAFIRLLLARQDTQTYQELIPVVSTIADSLETLHIIEAIYTSAQLGRRVDLSAEV